MKYTSNRRGSIFSRWQELVVQPVMSVPDFEILSHHISSLANFVNWVEMQPLRFNPIPSTARLRRANLATSPILADCGAITLHSRTKFVVESFRFGLVSASTSKWAWKLWSIQFGCTSCSAAYIAGKRKKTNDSPNTQNLPCYAP